MDQNAYIKQLESLVEDLSSQVATLEQMVCWHDMRIKNKIIFEYRIRYRLSHIKTWCERTIDRFHANALIRNYKEHGIEKAIQLTRLFGSSDVYGFKFYCRAIRKIDKNIYIVLDQKKFIDWEKTI